MNSEELLGRLRQFSYRVVKLTEGLPETSEARVIKGQILRSAFSAAVYYRSACKADSNKLFREKLGISFEELEETVYWLEVIGDLSLVGQELLSLLLEEGEELCKILAKSLITSRRVKP
jgi:four helix bundle protein